MRLAGGARPPGESMRGPGNRDDLPTLRVTNISEDTQENDLRELFGHFGKVARVYVGRDRETGAGKGFAFVSFDDKAAAQKAIEKVNGKGYDNLILSVQWSRKFVHVHSTPFFLMVILLNRTSAWREVEILEFGPCVTVLPIYRRFTIVQSDSLRTQRPLDQPD